MSTHLCVVNSAHHTQNYGSMLAESEQQRLDVSYNDVDDDDDDEKENDDE